jgi:hypothetical protein
MPSPQTRKIIINLLRGAAPERAVDIGRFFNDYQPAVELTQSGPGAVMEADKDRIHFNETVLDAVWLLAFSAWRAIETYSPAIVVATFGGATVESILSVDQSLGPIEQDYKARFAAAKRLLSNPQPGSVQWPPDVPKPTDERSSLSLQDTAAFDLACLTLAAFFLHECKHVAFANEPNRPIDLAAEEMACDVHSRAFLTEKLAEYARSHNHNYKQVLSKRAFGLAVSAISIHEMTPHYARWGNAQYPSVGARIEALVGDTALDDNADFWLFTGCLLTGVLRQDNQRVEIVPRSYRDYAEGLIVRLK